MRIKLSILAFVFVVLSGSSAFGQDLGKLPPRVQKLWELRKQANKLDALPFVQSQTRQIFLQSVETPISNFKISALEFTDDPNRIDVVLTVRALVPQIGQIDRMVREAWIWENGDWVMRASSPANPFTSDTPPGPASAERAAPEFKIANATIDVGRHAQGDLIEGKIPFRGNRAEIVLIRPLQSIPGLAVGSPVWSSPTEGYIPYQWETTLVSQDVNQSITLEATGSNDGHAKVPLQFRVRIDGKVGFKQIPEIIDPTRAGQVELQIQNLTKTPLRILSVASTNPAYTVKDEDITQLIEPGKSGHIVVRYSGQAQPSGSSLRLGLSEKLSPSSITTVPINVKLAEDKPAVPVREQLERIIPPEARRPQQ